MLKPAIYNSLQEYSYNEIQIFKHFCLEMKTCEFLDLDFYNTQMPSCLFLHLQGARSETKHQALQSSLQVIKYPRQLNNLCLNLLPQVNIPVLALQEF